MKKLLLLITSAAMLFLISCQPDELETVVKPQPQTGLSVVEEAFPGIKGTLEKGYLFGTPIEFVRKNGEAIFQGDIILTPEQLAVLPTHKNQAQTEGTGRSLLASRWPGNVVYYTIDPALSSEKKSWVSSAIAHWQANSAVRFITRTNQTNYVTFRSGNACSSNAGMIGNQQFINVGNCSVAGSVIHEIGHTLGLWHEQSRVDRNNYININWTNIIPGEEFQFQTYKESGNDGFDNGPFDFGSIMMYGSYAFSKNNLPTITKKNGATFSSQRTGLSAGDKSIINLMYFAWNKMPGAAKDIGVGANGTVYVVGAASVPGGYEIYRWNGSGWTHVPGGAVRVAVSPTGVPWIVSNDGGIFRLTNGVWQKMPGAAKDIGIGADGTVYVIGVAAVAGGYEIYKWNGSGWKHEPGGAVRIAVNPYGLPSVVNSIGEIYDLSLNGVWVRRSGSATDIGFDPEGSRYIIGKDAMPGGYGIYIDRIGGWDKLPGAAVAISAGPKGTPYVVSSDGAIFKGLSLRLN